MSVSQLPSLKVRMYFKDKLLNLFELSDIMVNEIAEVVQYPLSTALH